MGTGKKKKSFLRFTFKFTQIIQHNLIGRFVSIFILHTIYNIHEHFIYSIFYAIIWYTAFIYTDFNKAIFQKLISTIPFSSQLHYLFLFFNLCNFTLIRMTYSVRTIMYVPRLSVLSVLHFIVRTVVLIMFYVLYVLFIRTD